MARAFRTGAIVLGCWALGWAQQRGTTPKPKPGDYPAQARAGNVIVAAEYLVHTLPGKDINFVVPGYLVVEVALLPRNRGPSRSQTGSLSCGSTAKRRSCLRMPLVWLPRR
jgi:hypothetical protein